MMTRTYSRGLAAIAALLALTASSAPASTSIDLTTAGANNFDSNNSAALGGTFIVQQTSGESTGGGVIDPFLRLRGHGRSEEGYNTDARPLQFDEKSSPAVTHKLLLSDVPTVSLTVGGVTETYRQFLLNIREGYRRDLSLNQVQIFLREFGDLAGATVQFEATKTTPPVIAFVDSFSADVFRLNNNDADFLEIQLKDLRKANSGPGDMFLYVRDAAFQEARDLAIAENPELTLPYVYLYSQFGKPGAYRPNGRAEEWSIIRPPGPAPVPVPEPPTVVLALSGVGTLGLAGLGCRRRALRMSA